MSDSTLSAGRHTITLAVSGGDGYGVEIDWVRTAGQPVIGPLEDGTVATYGAGSSLVYWPAESIASLTHVATQLNPNSASQSGLHHPRFGLPDTVNMQIQASFRARGVTAATIGALRSSGPFTTYTQFAINVGPMAIAIDNYLEDNFVPKLFMSHPGIEATLKSLFPTWQGVFNEVATFSGTDGNDNFVVTVGTNLVVSVNGVNQTLPRGIVKEIRIDGKAGQDSIRVTGDATNQTATIAVGSIEFLGPDHKVIATSVEKIWAFAGSGDDRASFSDSPGNDLLASTTTFTYLQDSSFYNYAEGFDRVTVTASAGGSNDRAYFYDSPGNDLFAATPAFAYMQTSATYVQANGFDFTQALGTAGGTNDRAVLYDSAADDLFAATPAFAYLQGAGFYNQVNGFEMVRAVSNAGGSGDRAYLYDSTGADIFAGTPTYAYLNGASFLNEAYGFDQVMGISNSSGAVDRANFYDSAGNDFYLAMPLFAYLSGTGFNNQANGFESTYAFATAGGSNDRAMFYDSAGNDLFASTPEFSYMQGSGYYNQANGTFESVIAFVSVGTDRAVLYDSGSDDIFVRMDQFSYMQGPGRYVQVDGFDLVEVYATRGGYDRANIYDSTSDDLFFGRGSRLDLRRRQTNAIICQVTGFDEVSGIYSSGNDLIDVTTVDYIFKKIGY